MAQPATRALLMRSLSTMEQRAPYPTPLADLLDRLAYKPGWTFSLEATHKDGVYYGLCLVISAYERDTDNPADWRRFNHSFPIPPLAYHTDAWRRWLLDRILDVERHEACEFFRIDHQRPFLPDHGVGGDLYTIEARSIPDLTANVEQYFSVEVDRDWAAQALAHIADCRCAGGRSDDELHTLKWRVTGAAPSKTAAFDAMQRSRAAFLSAYLDAFHAAEQKRATDATPDA